MTKTHLHNGKRPYRIGCGLFLGLPLLAIVVFVVWWASLKPRADRDWSPDVAHLATGDVRGHIVTLHNVRNFTWRTPEDFDARWETRHYDLNNITGIDLFLSYWGMSAIAHTLVSFEFSNGDHVVFSVEIRKEKGETFSNIAGFFRQYELALIAADERDIIYYRTNVTGQDVYRYRLTTKPEGRKKLFLSYLNIGQHLAVKPEFYNTLTSNCTTIVFHMAQAISPGLTMDPRILLSGYLPGYIHDHDAAYKNITFERMKADARITAKALAAGHLSDFSYRIRTNETEKK